jgi:hypothetical protein
MEQEGIWYFAIGSMMNPISLKNRGIFPKKSMPAEVQDFELTFFGKMGMACADVAPGKSFHGVLHLCSEDEMKSLDALEGIYTRIPSKAKLYDDSLVDCTVYSDPTGKIDHSNDKPPTERYI